MDNNISHSRHDQLIEVMLRYDTGMAKQIQHFLKVYEFAHLIGTAEGLDMRTEDILETTAIVHDVGIREALKKYGSSDGKYQEELGPMKRAQCLQHLVMMRISLIVYAILSVITIPMKIWTGLIIRFSSRQIFWSTCMKMHSR